MDDETAMPTPRQQSPFANGASHANLFVEADPDHEPFTSRHPTTSTRTAVPARRGRGLVVPVDSPAIAPIRSADAARFTRPDGGVGRLSASAQAQLRTADVRAGALLRRLATPPYAPLAAVTAVAAMLIALSWLGLALRDAAAGRHSAERAQVAATATLSRDRARIAGLGAQLAQTELNARRQRQASAAATAAWRARALAAEHKLAGNQRRRGH
jgi:hypothetical protein